MNIHIYSHIWNRKLINKYNILFQSLYIKTNEILRIKKNKDVDINFINKFEIKKLNFNYRNKNKITDVISFAFDESDISQQYLGEIYICYYQAKKQAKLYGHSLEREICFLFVHGLLHLYGYDHLNDKDEIKMMHLQEKILKTCKIYRK